MAQFQTFPINSQNDLFLSDDGNLAMAEDKTALANIIQNVMQTRRGELRYDRSAGVPYFETLLGVSPNVELWKYYAGQEVERIDGISRVRQLVTRFSEGIFSYEMVVESTIGELVI